MSLSGLFNIGHDVGGFFGPSPGPELLCRFVEFCSLWPRFVMNSWKEDGLVTLPWMHPQIIAEVRAAMRLRYRLMPYLYTQMWQASRTGAPPLRPLFCDFPEDAGIAAVEDAFMVGPDLIVAPVLDEGARMRSLRLPAHPGGWYDWHTGAHLSGGAVATVAAPLGRLPLFVRAGAMIPVGAQFGGLLRARDDIREMLVFGAPEQPSTAWLYEDDGDTAAWRDGDCFAACFRLDATMLLSAELHHDRHRPAYDRIAIRPHRAGGAPLTLGSRTLGPVELTLAGG